MTTFAAFILCVRRPGLSNAVCAIYATRDVAEQLLAVAVSAGLQYRLEPSPTSRFDVEFGVDSKNVSAAVVEALWTVLDAARKQSFAMSANVSNAGALSCFGLGCARPSRPSLLLCSVFTCHPSYSAPRRRSRDAARGRR